MHDPLAGALRIVCGNPTDHIGALREQALAAIDAVVSIPAWALHTRVPQPAYGLWIPNNAEQRPPVRAPLVAQPWGEPLSKPLALDTPQARARYAIDHPDVLHTSLEYRALLGELLDMLSGQTRVATIEIKADCSEAIASIAEAKAALRRGACM